MKKSIVIAPLFIASLALASGGHFHPKKVAECKVEICTVDEINTAVRPGIKELANWKKIDAGIWQNAKVENIELKKFKKNNKKKNGPEELESWVVTLVDEKQTDTLKNRAYLFFLKDGSIFRTNTTGELK